MEQFTKNAWRRGQVVSALLLDIQAAFPNMRKDRLIENMRARNLVNEYCDFIDMILMQRQIQLKFDDHTSTPFSPMNGCCQGCPLSMLLYAIYNAPLIRVATNDNPKERIVGFVDDTTLLASGKNFEEAHSTLKDMMERKNGVFEWSQTFNSPLEMNKLALVNFTHSHKKANKANTLVLTQPATVGQLTHRIQASPHAKLLGVILDSKLTWSVTKLAGGLLFFLPFPYLVAVILLLFTSLLLLWAGFLFLLIILPYWGHFFLLYFSCVRFFRRCGFFFVTPSFCPPASVALGAFS